MIPFMQRACCARKLAQDTACLLCRFETRALFWDDWAREEFVFGGFEGGIPGMASIYGLLAKQNGFGFFEKANEP